MEAIDIGIRYQRQNAVRLGNGSMATQGHVSTSGKAGGFPV